MNLGDKIENRAKQNEKFILYENVIEKKCTLRDFSKRHSAQEFYSLTPATSYLVLLFSFSNYCKY